MSSISKYNLINYIFNNLTYFCDPTIDLDKIAEEYRSTSWAVAYFVVALICFIPYVIFLMAMLNKDIIKLAAYKIMFFCGIINIIILMIIGFLGSFYQLMGYFYCHNKHIEHIVGSMLVGFYNTRFTAEMLLAFNRMIEIFVPQKAACVFSKNKLRLYFSLIILFIIFNMFMFSFGSYSSKRHTFTTFVDLGNSTLHQDSNNNLVYININNPLYHLINNTVYTTVSLISYISIGIYLFYNKYLARNDAGISKLAIQLTVQALCVSILNLCEVFVSYSVLIIQNTDFFIFQYSHINWIIATGSSGLVMLFLNQTLREVVKNWFQKKKLFLSSLVI